MRFKYNLLYWSHYFFYLYKWLLFLIFRNYIFCFYLLSIIPFFFKVKRNSLTCYRPIRYSSYSLGISRNFSSKAVNTSKVNSSLLSDIQCIAIIKSKKSKLYGCRCSYKAKFGNFCGKHKNIESKMLSDSKMKSRCIASTKMGLPCTRLVFNKYCFQHKKQQITFIDLFSGAGGFGIGFIKAGFDPLLFVDSDKDCCDTLKLNHENITIVNDDFKNTDLTTFKGKADVLLAGSPCQSFSQIGLRKGLLDKNGKCLLDLIKAIFVLCPKVFVIENVRGLYTHDKGKTFQYIISLLSANNIYKVEYELINMSEYGIPQKRVRLLIVGHFINLKLNILPLPKIYPKLVLRDVLFNVPKSEGAQYPASKIKLFKLIPQGGCWVNLSKHLQKEYLGNSFNSSGGKRGILRRLSFDESSLTLLCSPSQKQTERCHPLENRPLNIKEYARIQTFPDNYKFNGNMSSKYRQIGNSVPPKFSHQLASQILRQLNTNSCSVKRGYHSGTTGGLSEDYKKGLETLLITQLEKEHSWLIDEGKHKRIDDCLMPRFTYDERLIHLKIHRASITHGAIWPQIFAFNTGYIQITGLDLKNLNILEVIELKNKTTSVNSDSKANVYKKLANYSQSNPGWTPILGYVNGNKPRKQLVMFNNQKILILTSDCLFEHILGDRWLQVKNFVINFILKYKT